jgi:hypothetical protein
MLVPVPGGGFVEERYITAVSVAQDGSRNWFYVEYQLPKGGKSAVCSGHYKTREQAEQAAKQFVESLQK